MKILITGSSGQLGKSFKKVSGNNYDIIYLTKEDLNLFNFNKCFSIVEDIKPDILLNFAAYTNVDDAEENSNYAMAINAEAPKAFALALKKTGGRLLHISTDYVFDGKQNIPYSIYQRPNPINLYGKSKYKGEEYIKQIMGSEKQSIIVRTSWLMSPFGNNFATKMLQMHKTNSEIAVVSDQIGSPSSALDLARICLLIINNWSELKKDKTWRNNILHWSNQGVASWYDIAFFVGEIATDLGLIKKPALIKPVKSTNYKTIAKRPSFSVMDCIDSRNILKSKSYHWKESLFYLLQYLAKQINSNNENYK